MESTKEINKEEETKQYIKEVRLIDDSFFEIFFKEDPNLNFSRGRQAV